MEAWKYSAEEVLKMLHSSVNGLSKDEALKRLKIYGENVPYEKRKRTLIRMVAEELFNPMGLLLLTASILSLLIGEVLDALLIVLILLLNIALGVYQEYKAERILEQLRNLTSPKAKVIRDGGVHTIDPKYIVPGDIVLLSEGDIVPADGRLIEGFGLRVDESLLTGESMPVEKDALWKGDAPLFERKNMVFLGTRILEGYGKMVVVYTGRNTVLGRISSKVEELEEELPFDREMRRLTWILAIASVISGIIAGILNLGNGVLFSLLLAISVMVAAVPEGLPVTITMALAYGSRRIGERGVLVRKLKAIESMGEINVICTDKTGTITVGKPKVVEVWGDKDTIALISSCCRREPPDELEEALLEYFGDRWKCKQFEVVPFSSERKYMSTKILWKGEEVTLFKGAPEIIHNIAPNHQALTIANRMASKGLKVLGFALCRRGNCKFVGVVGLLDPPREEVKDAVKEAKSMGIRTVIVTGDHMETARYVASLVGVEGEVLEGKQLELLDDKTLSGIIDKVGVFARVTPDQKVRIVRVFKEKGYVVGMVGDGINDAPALKEAHIGIGISKGAQIVREVADIVLIGSYKALVEGIKEGRYVIASINSFLRYLIPSNVGEVIAVVGGSLLGSVIIKPVQLLLLNIVTDGPPAVALALDRGKENVKHVLDGVKKDTILVGSLLGMGAIITYAITQSSAAVFLFFVLGEFARMYQVRGNFLSNKLLLFSLLASLLLGFGATIAFMDGISPLNIVIIGSVVIGVLLFSKMLGRIINI